MRESMEIYPRTAAERAMKLHEVLLRASAGKIKWWQAAELVGISERQLRRWRKRLAALVLQNAAESGHSDARNASNRFHDTCRLSGSNPGGTCNRQNIGCFIRFGPAACAGRQNPLTSNSVAGGLKCFVHHSRSSQQLFHLL